MQALKHTGMAGDRQHGMELAAPAVQPAAASRAEAELVDFVLSAGLFRERLARWQPPRRRSLSSGGAQWQS